MTQPPTIFRKRFVAELGVKLEDRSVIASISSINVDRDGDVLIPQGCDASDFLKSPTIFFNHDYNLPIGKCTAIKRSPQHLEATTIFAKRPKNHRGDWLADTLLSLFQQEVIHGFSVGFAPIEGRKPTTKDKQVFGDKVNHVYSKWKLLEYSVAPLPANQDALALAVSKGLVSAQAVEPYWPELCLPKTKNKVMIVVPAMPKSKRISQITQRHIARMRGQLYLE
ncbi:MAG: HK97 family phage prohead protease [Phycisphaeraceae bacterium]|nr:HK97 family phage prohead protease [Phycisphaeraceae bacterium]